MPGNAFRGSTTLGHIGYGYLYTNFGPQIRYTTPDLGGVKIALEIAEPYKISADTAKTNSPRVEAEVSYAAVLGGTALQAWVSGLYQTAPRRNTDITDDTGAVTRLVGRKARTMNPSAAQAASVQDSAVST